MADQPPAPSLLVEIAAAVGAALVAGYVRGRQDPRPWSWARFAAYSAEAIVCGFLAVAVAAGMKAADWIPSDDLRVVVGVSSAFGLLGTAIISDALSAWVKRRAAQ